MIQTNPSKHYWNYFLSIEEDLERVARFIEFDEDNLQTYSIELAKIFLSASSEIDVFLKQICHKMDDLENPKNINGYRKVIISKLPEFIEETVFVHRYGFQFNPWEEWSNNKNPNWWTNHNKVKHQRNIYFKEANVENVLKALGALLICVTYFYKLKLQEDYKEKSIKIDMNKTCELLNPKSKLFKFKAKYHQHPVYIY